MSSAEIVHAALSNYGFRFSSESVLQTGVARVLEAASIAYEKEVRLTPQDRLDFLCEGSVVIECKIDGSTANLRRQLERYAQHDRVESIVVLTNRVKHNAVQGYINGRPVLVCSLIGGAF